MAGINKLVNLIVNQQESMSKEKSKDSLMKYSG